MLVVGELNLDLILNKIKGFPAVGQEIMADDMNLVMGSSSAIFAANISRLGIPVSFCGMVGNDFAIYLQLSDTPSDKLGVLRAEI